MTDLATRLKLINETARHRHASTEEATASIVGILKEMGEDETKGEQTAEYALYALSHFAILIGNIASAANEAAAAYQEIAAYSAEACFVEAEEKEKASVKPNEREFLGKGPRNT